MEELPKIVINEKWHPETKKVYWEMLQDFYFGNKTNYKYNFKTQIFEKIVEDIDYCI